MTTKRSRRTTLGISVTTVLGIVVGTGVTVGWGTNIATAALGGTTEFEIDGNTAVDGGQDWASVDAPNLRDLTVVDDFCASGPDETGVDQERVVPGTKIDDVTFDAIPTNDGQPNKKSDLCNVYEAWELVFVPDAGNPDPNAGQYEFVYYGGWSRPDVQGEIDVLFPLLGPIPNDNSDDLVISYDFNDNTGLTVVEVLEWDGAAWASSDGLPDGTVEALTNKTLDVSGPFDVTFGEFAINLTASGILPENGPCRTFTAGDPVTRTGNSPSATLEDIVRLEPFVLTNCSSLTVTKETRPAVPAGSQPFDIRINELDGAPIRDGGIIEILDTLTVPDTPTQTYTDLLISPDYVVSETEVPDGWTQESLICKSLDPITGENVTRTLYSDRELGPDASFPVAPGVVAECVILNSGPPTVTVQKTTIGGVGGPFGFTLTDANGAVTPLTATTTQANTPTTVDQGTVEVPPGSVTVTETSVADGFLAGDIKCTVTRADGTIPLAFNGVASGGFPAGVTFDLESGDSAICVQDNIAFASVDVTKTVAGTSTDWEFDFTISPVPSGEDATKTATADAPTVSWDGLTPGVDYTITEEPEDGYISGVVNCDGDATFNAFPGQAVTCGITNIELADVTVTKTVAGTASGWAFDFTISPVPTGQTATKTATKGAPNVSWSGLNPAINYTITEKPVAGFITGTLACGGTDGVGTSTIDPDPGESVTCAITNTELADVSVTKTVAGTSTDWKFDFTISPVPQGQTAKKSATAGAATVSWSGLTPGVAYTITEAPVAGYLSGTVNCDGDGTFTPTPGQSVSCAITNTELADVAVTKTVEPTETGWSFDFTISPVPAGQTATKTATATSPTVGWAGLRPGVAYTITEEDTSDLVKGTLVCTGGTNSVGTSTFTPTPGGSTTCSITNTRIADIQVVKTSGAQSVLPGGAIPWTIQVTNNGPSTALDVRLTDKLPAQLTLVSVDAPDSWDCSATITGRPGTVSCSKPDMLPGETWSFTVNTTATAVTGGETITNVAVVTTTTTETTTDNNTDSASSSVVIVAVLPPTGGYVETRLLIAGLLVGVGVALVLVQQQQQQRRRRNLV